MRENWINLNGKWQFEIDNGNSGVSRKLYEPCQQFSMEINVPFCPESKLSGIENKVKSMNLIVVFTPEPQKFGRQYLRNSTRMAGRKQCDDVLALVYKTTKAVNPTRPCIDTSGNFHVLTDIFDVHDYEQNVEKFAKSYDCFSETGTFYDRFANRQLYSKGMSMFVSEYGGIRWTEDSAGWGYGDAPTTSEEFLERLKGLTDVLLDNPCMFGFCYTQLTDVEQEQNGLYTYDRKPKFEPEKIHPIFARKAAIEK